jgi:hypothetical protein
MANRDLEEAGPLPSGSPFSSAHRGPHWVPILASCLLLTILVIIVVFGLWAVRRSKREVAGRLFRLKALQKTKDIEGGGFSSVEGETEGDDRNGKGRLRG